MHREYQERHSPFRLIANLASGALLLCCALTSVMCADPLNIVCISDLTEDKPTVKVYDGGTCAKPKNDITATVLTLTSSSADPETLLFNLSQTNAIKTTALFYSALYEDKVGGDLSDIVTASLNKGQTAMTVAFCSDPFKPFGLCSDLEGFTVVKQDVETGDFQDEGTYGEGPMYNIFVQSDVDTPEPASVILLLTAIAAVGFLMPRLRHQKHH